MKKVLVICLVCFTVTQLLAQHLIGLHKNKIADEMKKSYPDFVIDNSTVNTTYNYLKYVNKFDEQTLLVFLSDLDTCTATKLISDYSKLEEVKADLKKRYKPSGKDKWVYTHNKTQYLITLKRDEWFFSVFTSKKKK
jgi:hypothetical protein